MRTYSRLLTMLLLCDVHKPVAIILYDNANMQMHIKHTSRSVIFSKRDYVTFAICRLSSDVCRPSVTLVSPTQPVEIFRSFFTIRYLGHPLISTENFTEIVPGEPLRPGI